jgi:hypothetical protein
MHAVIYMFCACSVLNIECPNTMLMCISVTTCEAVTACSYMAPMLLVLCKPSCLIANMCCLPEAPLHSDICCCIVSPKTTAQPKHPPGGALYCRPQCTALSQDECCSTPQAYNNPTNTTSIPQGNQPHNPEPVCQHRTRPREIHSRWHAMLASASLKQCLPGSST